MRIRVAANEFGRFRCLVSSTNRKKSWVSEHAPKRLRLNFPLITLKG